MKSKNKIIIFFSISIIFLWLVYGVIDFIVFSKGSFLNILISDLSIKGIIFRVINISTVFLFGLIVYNFLNKYRILETKKEKVKENKLNKNTIPFINKENIDESMTFGKQIQHKQKLESLGMIARSIAHDFNNLFVGVLGNADLVLHELPSSSPIKKRIVSIQNSTQKASDLCRKMLSYSEDESMKNQKIDINDVVKEMSNMLRVVMTKTIVVKYNYSEGIPKILADEAQIKQIIMSLIFNASDAIDEKGGIISITIGSMKINKNFIENTFVDENKQDNAYVFLEVKDTGCGMDNETKGKIFNPFFSTKYDGRGLGMYAVFELIKKYNGYIKVESEVGIGTTITILFPVEKGEVIKSANTLKKIGSKNNENNKILLVDDEETVREIVQQMLEKLGLQVITACDGVDALKKFKNNKDQINCVILDLTMPFMGGEQTFREIQKIDPNINVIMSSGYNKKEMKRKFLGKGVADFIQKPYTLSVLSEKLYKIL